MEQNVKIEFDYYQRLRSEINTLELKRSQLETEINLPTTIGSLKKEVSILQGAKRQLDLDIDSLKREKARGVEIRLSRKVKELQVDIDRLEIRKENESQVSILVMRDTRKVLAKLNNEIDITREELKVITSARNAAKNKSIEFGTLVVQTAKKIAEGEELLLTRQEEFDLRSYGLTSRENEIVLAEKEVQDKTRLLTTEINIKLQAIQADENKVKELHAKNLNEITTARNALNAGQTKLQTNIIAWDEQTSALGKSINLLDERTKKLEEEKAALKTNKEIFLKEKQDYEWSKNKLL